VLLEGGEQVAGTLAGGHDLGRQLIDRHVRQLIYLGAEAAHRGCPSLVSEGDNHAARMIQQKLKRVDWLLSHCRTHNNCIGMVAPQGGSQVRADLGQGRRLNFKSRVPG
jgi:hypothetical protein